MEQNNLKFVCFFDILGFKDIVINNSHAELDKIYENLFEGSSQDVISRWSKVMEKMKITENLIEIAIISDSIILWSKYLSQKSFIQLLFFSRKLIQNGFYNGLPLRGALSAGSITARNTSLGTLTIYGKGLVDSYLLEESQNWSGCVVDDKAISCLIELTKNSSGADLIHLEETKFLIKHTLHLKDNIKKELYAINWVRYLNKDFTDLDIENSFSLLNKRITDRTQSIIENTIEFYKKIKDSD